MSKIAVIKHCKECPHFDYVFKNNYRSIDSFYCAALDKWLHGGGYIIHEECPLENNNIVEEIELIPSDHDIALMDINTTQLFKILKGLTRGIKNGPTDPMFIKLDEKINQIQNGF